MKRPLLVSGALLALLAVSASRLEAQCGGNGGNARLESDPQAIGTFITFTVRGGAGQPYLLFVSDGLNPTTFPFGTVCIDLASPNLFLVSQGNLDAQGVFALTLPFPFDPNLLNLVLYAQAGVGDPAAPLGLAISNALRIDLELVDSYVTLPAPATGRALATGNLAGDGRVLIAGGGSGTVLAPAGTSSTDIFDPVTRSFTPGPFMSVTRAFHTGTTLLDGRVLITGGVSGGSGAVASSCEIYNPATNSFSPAASMSTARAAHNAVRLNDGRVLVVGGTSTFVGTSLAPILNASIDSGEVYNPATNTWTPVSNVMASKRFGSASVLLNNGNVAITSGINGSTNLLGQDLPTFTATTSIYNPATNSFSAGGSVGTARAFHGLVKLSDGRIWMTAGLLSGLIPGVTNTTRIGTATAASFAAGPNLPQAIAIPSQVALRNGNIHLAGGINGNLVTQTFSAVADAVRYNGTTLLPKTAMPAAQGNHVAVLLPNGSVLMAGGADASGASTSAAYLYTPDP